MNQDLQRLLSQPTASVPEVGRVVFNMSRGASYEAAKRGDIRVVDLGRLKRVPTQWVRTVLGLDGQGASK